MTTHYLRTSVCGRRSNLFNGSPKRTGNAAKAVARAKSKGWSRDVRSTYTDLCPGCLAESRKTVSPA